MQLHPDGTVKCVHIATLHQILILDNMKIPERLPNIVQENMLAFRSFYPNSEYKLWNGEELRSLIELRFGRNVTAAFDTLKPYAFKSDLARYCLLYEMGGLYSDLLFEHRAPLRIPVGYGVAAFKEVPFMTRYTGGISNSLLWSVPRRAEYAVAIDRIVDNCKKKFYGINMLDPTGPLLLGRAFSVAASSRWMSGEVDDQLIGENIHKTTGGKAFVIWAPEDGKGDSVYRLLNSIKVDVGGRPKDRPRKFTMEGTNNYPAMWNARDVYR
jgi:mannosyltransferase OCH1-like enzyme